GDYEVYFDGKGDRVIVDSFTGKVVAIQPPQTRFDRRSLRADERRRQLRQQRDDRYYLDDPDDVARLRRRQMEEEGGFYPPVQESDPYSDGFVPLDDGSYGQAYPEDWMPPTPRDMERGGITSEPLDQAAI